MTVLFLKCNAAYIEMWCRWSVFRISEIKINWFAVEADFCLVASESVGQGKCQGLVNLILERGNPSQTVEQLKEMICMQVETIVLHFLCMCFWN